MSALVGTAACVMLAGICLQLSRIADALERRNERAEDTDFGIGI